MNIYAQELEFEDNKYGKTVFPRNIFFRFLGESDRDKDGLEIFPITLTTRTGESFLQLDLKQPPGIRNLFNSDSGTQL